jgi:glycosyltransferase involved in cell wall biosynthesis
VSSPPAKKPLVTVDADVLGRQRTGDESYVANLLRELPAHASDLRLAAVTRRPELVPEGVEAVPLDARSQPLRMGLRLPRLLRRLRPALAHFLHVVPPGWRGPAVLTVQDLSFERFPELMSRADRFYFRTFVPRSARAADRVLTGSEWTKRDLVERYGIEPSRIMVTPYGFDPVFKPEGPRREGAPYALFVGALQERKEPELALRALLGVDSGMSLVFAGPDRGLKAELHRRARTLGLKERVEFAGHVPREDLAALYRGAEALVFPSRYEGFGLPVLEAMASGTPVVATRSSSIPEVAGDAAILVEPDADALAAGLERAGAERDRLRGLGLARAAQFSWAETARRTAEAYREVLVS